MLKKTSKNKRFQKRAKNGRFEEDKSDDHTEPIRYRKVDANMPLVLASQKSLVTPFTFLTMQQLRPCNNYESRSRGREVDYGFPGLECMHCQPNARRFFLKSADKLRRKMLYSISLVSTCSFHLIFLSLA